MRAAKVTTSQTRSDAAHGFPQQLPHYKGSTPRGQSAYIQSGLLKSWLTNVKRLTWQLVVGREKGSRLGHCVGRAVRSHLSEREREKEMIKKRETLLFRGGSEKQPQCFQIWQVSPAVQARLASQWLRSSCWSRGRGEPVEVDNGSDLRRLVTPP